MLYFGIQTAQKHKSYTNINLRSTLDPNENFRNDEETEDGGTQDCANTLLSEQAAESTSIFRSGDKRTNVLETEDTNDMIITVEHSTAVMEEGASLEFPLQTTPEVDRKVDSEDIMSPIVNKTDNSEPVSPPSA